MSKKVVIFIIIITFTITLLFVRSYLFHKMISKGDEALLAQKYTLAFVYFEKAQILEFGNKDSETKKTLAKDAAKDISKLTDLAKEKNRSDLLTLISQAKNKACDLQTDRTLIEKDQSQIAKINLEFCVSVGPKDHQSWLFLGIADYKISQGNYVFKELKPEFRQAAIVAFENAYKSDPLDKTTLNYLIETNSQSGDKGKVDYWGKLLDNLNRIENP